MGRLSWWAPRSHGVLISGRQRIKVRKRKVTRETEVGVMHVTMEEEAMRKGILVAPRSWKRQEMTLSWGLWKECSLAFSLMRPVSDFSDSENCEMINLYCFKLLSLWRFVTAAIGNGNPCDPKLLFFFEGNSWEVTWWRRKRSWSSTDHCPNLDFATSCVTLNKLFNICDPQVFLQEKGS